MNILGSIQRWGTALYRLVDSTEPAKKDTAVEEKATPVDDDGPGAGGGYFDAVDIRPTVDGPGAGGGYLTATKEKAVAANSNDGPGAGGGYDDGDVDDDGPGAGGGYITHSIDGLSMTTSTQASWPNDIFSVSGYLLTGAANEDKFTASSEPKKPAVMWHTEGGAYFADLDLPPSKPQSDKPAQADDSKKKGEN